MNQGIWHNCGHHGHTIADALLRTGTGVGVVISPRDQSRHLAERSAERFHDCGAAVAIDPQFYVPDAVVGGLSTYPTEEFRVSVNRLQTLSEERLDDLATALEEMNSAVNSDAMIAPAVVYDAGQPRHHEANGRLFESARRAGDELGIPTWASVVFGASTTQSDREVEAVLTHATSLGADGYFVAWEFGAERLPTDASQIVRFGAALLTLACTGRPVMHSCAGPMCVLSAGFGATAIGISHPQNLWHFKRARYAPTTQRGGGGDAPARYFSKPLWGTIVFPDEIVQLPQRIRSRVLSPTAYSGNVGRGGRFEPSQFRRGKLMNMHLLAVLAETGSTLLEYASRDANVEATAILEGAIEIHNSIRDEGIELKDDTDAYQEPWRDALVTVLQRHEQKYDLLEALGED